MGLFKFAKKAGQSYVDLQKKHFELLKDVVGLDGKIGFGSKEKAGDMPVAPPPPAPTSAGTTAPKAPAIAKAPKPPVLAPEDKAVIIAAEAKSHGLGGEYQVEVKGDTVTLKGTVPDQETLEKIVLSSGNVEGVAEVDATAVTVAAPGEVSVFHTVKKGDTLSKIAKVYLADAMKYPVIFEANKPMLTDPDLIYPGQSLRIPGGKAPEPKA